jgi:hypothetical protein
MLRWFAVLLLLVLAPGAQACAGAGTPTLELDFPKPAGCARTAPEHCPALPEADLPVVIEGTFVWSWQADQCTANVPSATPVVVTFAGLERHTAGWLRMSTDPHEVVIPVQDQWDVQDDEVDPATGQHRGREAYPLTVTIELVGEPDEEALAKVANAGGAVDLFLKASAAATPTFGAGFGIETFLLDGRSALEPASGAGRDAPAPPLPVALALVGLAALARRRA